MYLETLHLLDINTDWSHSQQLNAFLVFSNIYFSSNIREGVLYHVSLDVLQL